MKSFVPIVIGGLPSPGLAAASLEDEDELSSSSPPHAAAKTPSARTSTSPLRSCIESLHGGDVSFRVHTPSMAGSTSSAAVVRRRSAFGVIARWSRAKAASPAKASTVTAIEPAMTPAVP